jgi:Tfp pilus assembly protein PilF/TolB-like protein
VTLAILPFRNASGEARLDSLGSSVSDVLRTELGQSSSVMTVPSDRLHQVLRDLRIEANTTLAPTELARVAEFANARTVLWGQLTRFGEAIRIDATLQDFDRGETVPLNAMAPNEGNLLGSIGELADMVRERLARGSPDILNELKSTSWKPSTGSFEALRLYNEGLRLTQQGNHQGAQKDFEAATKLDEHFALALSALAKSYATLGYDAEAAQFSRRAMSLSDGLPALERYQIAANHYQIVSDTAKAIESYENLAKASPNSAVVQYDLGGLYEQSGDFDKARDHYAAVVRLDPKFVEGQRAMGRIEIQRGNPQASLEPLNKALGLAIELNNEEARANVLQAIGIAYKNLNRPEEAIRRYQESLEIKRKLGPSQRRGMAASIGEIAQANERLGKPREAEQGLREALKIQREIGEKAGMSSTLTNLASLLSETLGRPDEALPLFQESLQSAASWVTRTARRWCLTISARCTWPRGSSPKPRLTSSWRCRFERKPTSRATWPTRCITSPKRCYGADVTISHSRSTSAPSTCGGRPRTAAERRSSRTASAPSSITRVGSARPSNRKRKH